MGFKSKRVIFILIIVGLLTTFSGCFEATDKDIVTEDDTAESDAERDTGPETGTGDLASDKDTVPDTDSAMDCDTALDSDTKSTPGEIAADSPACPDDLFPMMQLTIASKPGVTPTPEALCNAASDPATASSEAVTVTATIDPDAPTLTYIELRFISEISGRIVSTPAVEIRNAAPQAIGDAEISDVGGATGTYHVELAFPKAALPPENLADWWSEYPRTRFDLAIRFDLRCDDLDGEAPVTTVLALVPFDFCYENGEPYWAGPGDDCTVCGTVISEIIAAPLPPGTLNDGVLSGAVTARIIPVAAKDDMLLLVAGTAESSRPRFEWRASGGVFSRKDTQMVRYRKPADRGPHIVQVAVRDGDNLAVAVYRLEAV